MRYIRLLLTIQLIFLCSLVGAQSLSVESFRLLETDLTANTYGTMERDQNGDVAALIKVVTSETGFVFDGGMMGIVKTVQKTGEIWVYVPRAIQKITITHQQHGVLRDYYFPLTVEGARTYEMVLKLPNVVPVSSRTRAQFVVFKVEPRNAVVLVDNEAHTLNSEGQLSIRLNPGEHTYMVTAPSFETESGTVTVADSRIVKEINLSSLIGQLTINSDDDAQVYVNDEYMGNGSWTGSLNEGVYFVEVRRPSYKTTYQEVSLRRSENRVVSVRATEPSFGEVEVVSDPLDFDIYIDGEKKGVTPDFIDNVRTGTHVITLRKEKYLDRVIMVDVFEDSVAYVSVSDFEMIPESDKDKKKREALEAKAVKDSIKQAEKQAAKQKEITYEDIRQSDIYQKADMSDVFDVVDVMPVFPSGTAAMVQYFIDNFECPLYYNKGNGRVVVSFVVEKDGYVSHPYIVKGIDDVIDKEAIRVVNAMPRWTPGKIGGETVRVWQTVNINLRQDKTSGVSLGDDLYDAGITNSNNAKIAPNSFYVGGFYSIGKLMSYGGQVGFYARNFNVQADFGVHDYQIEGYWVTSASSQKYATPYQYTWKFNYSLSLRLGYGIRLARSLRLTPQIGGALTQLKSVYDESLKFEKNQSSTSYCFGAQAAAKLEWVMTRHLSLFTSSDYTIPLLKGDVAKRLDADKVVSRHAGGFSTSFGLNLIF